MTPLRRTSTSTWFRFGSSGHRRTLRAVTCACALLKGTERWGTLKTSAFAAWTFLLNPRLPTCRAVSGKGPRVPDEMPPRWTVGAKTVRSGWPPPEARRGFDREIVMSGLPGEPHSFLARRLSRLLICALNTGNTSWNARIRLIMPRGRAAAGRMRALIESAGGSVVLREEGMGTLERTVTEVYIRFEKDGVPQELLAAISQSPEFTLLLVEPNARVPRKGRR